MVKVPADCCCCMNERMWNARIISRAVTVPVLLLLLPLLLPWLYIVVVDFNLHAVRPAHKQLSTIAPLPIWPLLSTIYRSSRLLSSLSLSLSLSLISFFFSLVSLSHFSHHLSLSSFSLSSFSFFPRAREYIQEFSESGIPLAIYIYICVRVCWGRVHRVCTLYDPAYYIHPRRMNESFHFRSFGKNRRWLSTSTSLWMNAKSLIKENL